MRVFVDSNTLLSSALFPSGVVAKAMQVALTRHRVVICSYVLEESRRIVESKFPSRIDAFTLFLNSLDFETVYTPTDVVFDGKLMRDPKDVPILVTAQRENVDIILTGDKDFHALNLKKPEILSPRDFLNRFGSSAI